MPITPITRASAKAPEGVRACRLIGGTVLLGVLAIVPVIEFWPVLVGYIQKTQGGLHRELASAIRAVKSHPTTTGGSLVVLSFLYGVFHAAGPGHGKLIIATYLASHPTRLRHGLVVSVLSALFQGVTAIIAVGGGLWVLDLSARQATVISSNLELTSYGLIVLLGAYLAFTAAGRLHRARGNPAENAAGHDSGGHDGDQGCGHHHALVPVTDPATGIDWRQSFAMVVSIGIRPCSGAILVLVFAFALELVPAGIIAVFAMAAGTAITVSALAVLTIAARTWARRLTDIMPEEPGRPSMLGSVAALAGGLIIAAMGVSLALATLETGNHPLL